LLCGIVVVVRYFGGTKLGVSGLIDAYKTVAKECLDKSTILEKYIYESLELIFDASLQGEVMRLVKEFGGQIISLDYTNEIVLLAEFRKSVIPNMLQKTIVGIRIIQVLRE
jgi:putative IMPACT (imprinted ancient) family translation regulator